MRWERWSGVDINAGQLDAEPLFDRRAIAGVALQCTAGALRQRFVEGLGTVGGRLLRCRTGAGAKAGNFALCGWLSAAGGNRLGGLARRALGNILAPVINRYG